MAAVISRALDDLRGIQLAQKSPRAKDETMAWINGPDCEALCLFLEIDPAAIREKAAALYREFLAREDAVLLSRSA
jgi:3-methyladenine DNA glycosylase Mpg